jgi:hypothetical protein
MRWRDLLWLMLSWVLQRRPAEDGETLSRTLVEQQHDLALREEVQTVSEATKKTWAQLMEEQITTRVKTQFEERLRQQTGLNTSRANLIMRLAASFGILPEPLIATISACEDKGRLEAALLRVPAMKSLDEFQL